MPAMPSTVETALPRRSFLSLAAKSALALSGLLGLGGLLRFLSFETSIAAPESFDLGPVDDFSPGSRRMVPEAQAVVIRVEERLVAYSLICPHLGCRVEPDGGNTADEAGFACPCHGSRFGPQGELERGPAAEGLRELPLSVNAAGHLILTTK